MTYLDYSATTPVNDEVLETYVKVSKEFIGNPNSLHKLGVESKKIIDASTIQIESLLKIKDKEVIYTSGSSESNNLAIKGVALKYQNRGKHIITSPLEHSSIYGPLSYLQTLGFEVDFVKLNENGQVDLEDLKNLIREDTILVSITAVNSEIGITQPIEEIGNILKEYPKIIFHSDFTQCMGKKNIKLDNVDLVSFSSHKFYGVKGIGVLLRNNNIKLEPIIHGGKSTSIYRSGTPALPLIVSLSKALRLALNDLDKKYENVEKKCNDLIEFLSSYNVSINHNKYCLPHMLNISLKNIKPETFLHALEKYDIYISTQSACSTSSVSRAVLAFTNNQENAKSSIRISLSYLTTDEDIKYFKEKFAECIKRLG